APEMLPPVLWFAQRIVNIDGSQAVLRHVSSCGPLIIESALAIRRAVINPAYCRRSIRISDRCVPVNRVVDVSADNATRIRLARQDPIVVVSVIHSTAFGVLRRTQARKRIVGKRARRLRALI